LRRVVEKFEVGIENVNHDAVDTSSKNPKMSLKGSTRSTSDTSLNVTWSHWTIGLSRLSVVSCYVCVWL